MSTVTSAEHLELALEVSITQHYRWFRFQGVVDDTSLFACLSEVWRSPDYAFDRPELYDMRDARSRLVTAPGIRSAAKLDLDLFENTPARKVAILASGELEFGLARMFEGYIVRREHLVKVVATMEDARHWLEVPA